MITGASGVQWVLFFLSLPFVTFVIFCHDFERSVKEKELSLVLFCIFSLCWLGISFAGSLPALFLASLWIGRVQIKASCVLWLFQWFCLCSRFYYFKVTRSCSFQSGFMYRSRVPWRRRRKRRSRQCRSFSMTFMMCHHRDSRSNSKHRRSMLQSTHICILSISLIPRVSLPVVILLVHSHSQFLLFDLLILW